MREAACIKIDSRKLVEEILRIFGRCPLIASILSGKLVERSSTGKRVGEELAKVSGERKR